MSEKIIRDPVHDVIALRMDDPLEALLFRLLNAPEFQRLRRIRQLGMASLAYPGAEHSRYSHSLGVMETARKFLNQFSLQFKISEDQRTICLTSALLHDLGHGPFSHVFERVSGVSHETVTRRIILEPLGQIYKILAKYEPTLPQRVADCIACSPKRTFISDILCSQLDADRCDYLLRDNLMTGSQYGGFDLTWLIHALTIDESADRVAVTSKGISAVEAYLQSRYHMYRNVYFHKVVRSAEGMVKLALQRARRLARQDRLEWPPRDHAVIKSLLGRQLSVAEFTDLDDISVLHCFKVWQSSGDTILSRLCTGLLFRRLYKSIDLTHITDAKRISEIIAISRDVIQRSGGDPSSEFFYDQPADTPYESLADSSQTGGQEIMVKQPDGTLAQFAAISPLIQALNKQLMFRRIHVAEQWRGTILKVAAGG